MLCCVILSSRCPGKDLRGWITKVGVTELREDLIDKKGYEGYHTIHKMMI